jgi:hypothetical protein
MKFFFLWWFPPYWVLHIIQELEKISSIPETSKINHETIEYDKEQERIYHESANKTISYFFLFVVAFTLFCGWLSM